jgi:hypothetical protein
MRNRLLTWLIVGAASAALIACVVVTAYIEELSAWLEN